ncbi:MAG: autotransporter outer membrane beta-barrel domain-containing protein [Gammaproteobacteria bacterium AqS3]|nr:autotransporter outer membrane beta-barrel domain-containing protein [Gammaproteobacteria bacterium AqS3]
MTVGTPQDDGNVNEVGRIYIYIDEDRDDLHLSYRVFGIEAVAIDNEFSSSSVSIVAPMFRRQILAEGGSRTFTVRLSEQPSGSRTVNLSSLHRLSANYLTPNPASLTFTESTWNTPQMVTVRAPEDDDSLDEGGRIVISGAGVIGQLTSFEVLDDESGGLKVSSNSLTVNEGGSQTFTVRLTAAPAGGTASVTLESSNEDVVMINEEERLTLTFNDSNWNTPQMVMVSAPEDDNNMINEIVDIRLDAQGRESELIQISVIDNDFVGGSIELITSDPADGPYLAEGGMSTFTVWLAERPSGSRTVALISDRDSVTLDPVSLTFTESNWNAPQTVTVRASDDDFFYDLSPTVTMSGAGVIAQEMDFEVLDDDANSGIRLMTSFGYQEIIEGEMVDLAVRLVTRPQSDETVTLSSDNTDVVINPGSLTFTASNWSIPQTVRVGTVKDENQDHDSARIIVSGSGVRTRGLDLLLIDGDKGTEGIILSSPSLTVAEGGEGTFTVRLTDRPSEARTVVLDSPYGFSGISFGKSFQTALTFTESNWNIAQTVTVTARRDNDAVNETGKITLSSIGLKAKSVTVTVIDDDGAVGGVLNQEREIVKLLLAEIASGLISSAQEVVGQRLNDSARGVRGAVVAGQHIALDRSLMGDIVSGFASRAGGQDVTPQSRFAEGRFGAERQSVDWLGGMPLEDGLPVRYKVRPVGRGNSAALASSFSYALNPAGSGQGWSIWGRLDTREFSGAGDDDSEFEGSQGGFWLGADKVTEGGLLYGLAYGSNSADADYALGQPSGSIETDMTTVLPYLEVTGDNGATGHLMLGIGSGEATVTQTNKLEGTVDLSMQLLSVSGSWPMAELGSSTLSWSGDLGFSMLDADDSLLPALGGLSVDSTRLRGGMELIHDGFGDSWRVVPEIGALLRHDAGDGAVGTGIEVTSGLQIRSSGERFSVDVTLRMLAMHSAEDLSDWGVGVEFRLNSRTGGEGMSFAIGPSWGIPEDDVLNHKGSLQLNEVELRSRHPRHQARGMAANFAYGLRALGGLLTPYSEYDSISGEHGSTRQVVGLKFSDDDLLELRLLNEKQIFGKGLARSKLAVEIQRLF